MIFINPRTDFAFKKIFGSDQSKGILISFLNSILYPEEPTIQDLEILNPYQASKIRGVKDTYLDVKARLNSGEMVIIEMQVLNVEGFEKRVLYNAAKAYSIQLGKGESYSSLNPVIALTITDFEMFAEIESAVSRFVLQEKAVLVEYPISGLELVFVELPKFKLSLEELERVTDKWIYFLQHAPDLRAVPETMGVVAEIQQAFEMANQAILTPEELDELEHQLIFIQDQRGAITYATRIASEQARKQGLETGLQQGLQQGLEQGERRGKVTLIVKLLRSRLGDLPRDLEAQITELSITKLDELAIGLMELNTIEDLEQWMKSALAEGSSRPQD